MNDVASSKSRFSFGLRESFVGISAIAFLLFCESQQLGLGAVGSTVVMGGLSVFYIRNRRDLISTLAIGAVVYSMWWGIASNTERYMIASQAKVTFDPPIWFTVIETAFNLTAGAVCTFINFAFFKFWHFALTRPLQYEIDIREEATKTDTSR